MERLRSWAVDPRLVAIALGLSLFGIAMIYSAGVLNSPGVATGIWGRQAVWLGIALLAFTAVARIPLRWFEWAAFPGYAFAVVLLAITLVIGGGEGTAAGTRSFLSLGRVGFQPAEIAKIAVALALGRMLASQEAPASTMRQLIAPATLVAVPLVFIVLQPDLGSALAFVGILFAALFWAGTPVFLLVLLASPGAALLLTFDTRVWSAYFVLLAAFLFWQRYRLYLVESVFVLLANLSSGVIALPLWASFPDYQRNRLLVFLDPSIDPRGAGYHLTQSKIAIGSGGLFGKGFTEGTQKRLNFLPEQHTDFIVSVVGEELGFVGITLMLLGFGLLLTRLARMAQRAPDPFAGLVVFGMFGAWAVHIFVNIGMTVGLVPITGIPLPFVSYGGTFLLVSWVAVGMMARLAHER